MYPNVYSNQTTRKAFDAVTLSGTASDNRYEFGTEGFSKLTVDLGYAMGGGESANKLAFTLEHSPDGGVNWFSLVIDSTSTTSEITPRVWEITGTNNLSVIVDIAYKLMRISLTESGVATTAGTASVFYTISGN